MYHKLVCFSKRRQIIYLALTTFALSACDINIGGDGKRDSQETGAKIDPNSIVQVALLVPKGSGDPKLERLSNSFVNAAHLAMSDFPNIRIKLNVYATAGNESQAASVAKKAVSDGAKIIIGPLFAASANAVGNTVKANNINVLSFSNNTEIAGGNVFVLGNTFQNKADRIVSYANYRGYKRIAAVTSKNLAGQIATNSIRKAARKYGSTYTGNFSYPLSSDGINTASPIISGKIKTTRTTALVLSADFGNGLSTIANGLLNAQVHPTNIKYLGITRWDIPTESLAVSGLQGGWFTLPDSQAINKFENHYQKKYGHKPHPLAGLSYDGVYAIAKLLASGSPYALTKSRLTDRKGFHGAFGLFRLKRDGTNQRALAIAEVVNGRYRLISSAEQVFHGKNR